MKHIIFLLVGLVASCGPNESDLDACTADKIYYGTKLNEFKAELVVVKDHLSRACKYLCVNAPETEPCFLDCMNGQ